jgi:membrane fusion protein, macrolide-specific efflux system
MKSKLQAGWKWFATGSLLKKGIIIVIVLALLGFTGYRVYGQQNNKPQHITSQAEKGSLITSVTASGTISSANSASITSSATGVVSKVYVSNGDMVEAGQEIAEITLDTASQQKQAAAWASYLTAQNALNSANAKMNGLQSALFTANQKFVNGAGTVDPIEDDPNYVIQRADWLQAEADYNNQKGVIAQAQAALTSAALEHSQTSGTITAPMAGKVTNLTLTEGLSLAGSSDSSTGDSSDGGSDAESYGAITLEGGQPQATVNLSEIDVTKVKVGQKVTLTMDAFPDKSFTGKVSAIDTNGSVSSGVTTYPTTIVFDSAPDTVYPNMAVSASIITDIKHDVVLVPSAAVQTSNGQSMVRVMKDGKVTMVPVEIGGANDTQTEIVSGIDEGDTVVTSTITPNAGGQSGSASPFGSTGGGMGGGGMRIMQGGPAGGAKPVMITH